MDITVGTYGLLGLLVLAQRGFEDTEVLYLKKSNGVFLPLKCGDNTPGYYICNGTKRQFTFKALISVAKEQAANQSKASRPAAKAASSDSAMSRQQAFFKQVHRPLPKQHATASPTKEATKRPTEGKTGLRRNQRTKERLNLSHSLCDTNADRLQQETVVHCSSHP